MNITSLFFRKCSTLLLLTSLALTACSSNNLDMDSLTLSTSVFVGSDRHENGKGNYLKAVLSAVVNDTYATTPSVILLGGDYVGGGNSGKRPSGSGSAPTTSPEKMRPDSTKTPPKMTNPEFHVSSMDLEIDSAMAGRPHVDLFTYGAHDENSLDGYDPFFSGPYSGNGYYLYGISYAQMAYDEEPDTATYNAIDRNDPRGCCAQTATKNFDEWISTLTDNKPIIMMSHVPMHVIRNDNPGGETWYQSVSKAAEKHDILFLFCHNHTVEDQSATNKASETTRYLLTPGEALETQGKIVKSGHKVTSSETYNHTLNFYYGNAGYIKWGYGTLITFRRNSAGQKFRTMTLRRYSVIDPTPATIGYKTNPYIITLEKLK